jgi:tRNA (adenine37-N6)-methyltransferase
MRHLCYILLIALTFGMPTRSMAKDYSIQQIGQVVKSSDKTKLEIDSRFRDALLGLNGFSHLLVFYWFDQNDSPEKRATLRVHPRGSKANPLTGVFATRSPLRPNLIGLSVCKIKSIDETGITVDDIDAFSGSPLIDLKPYIPEYDSVPGASVPDWVKGR